MHLYTDASSTKGFGGFYQGKWFYDTWPKELPDISDKTLSMAFLELYPIVVAAVLWGKDWSGKRILFHCDNLAAVQILTKGRSKEPIIMKLMRRLVMCAATYNFAIYSEHFPGKLNFLADSLSRFQIEKFRQLAPDSEATATPCPRLEEIIWTPP
jgi:hypothetical protein